VTFSSTNSKSDGSTDFSCGRKASNSKTRRPPIRLLIIFLQVYQLGIKNGCDDVIVVVVVIFDYIPVPCGIGLVKNDHLSDFFMN
jgi:hypothetical protein